MCPVCASRCPGSGLAAGDAALVSPSGNEIVFTASAPGQIAATGPTSTAHAAAAVAVNWVAARRPSLTASSTTAMTSAGQAVAFIDASTPSTSPASTGRDARLPVPHNSARPRHISASTGTSVPPTASSKAITGLAVRNTVHRIQSCAPATASARSNASTNATPNQMRGSVITCEPASARGSPNSVITGRYGS